MRSSELDKKSYSDYLAELQHEEIEVNTSDYFKYIISAYPYFRSRLLIPGRCYEDDSHGAMAIGGSAHADIIDIDIWMADKSDEIRREVIDWFNGTSLEQVAYWRGLGKGHKATLSRRRSKIASRLARQSSKN